MIRVGFGKKILAGLFAVAAMSVAANAATITVNSNNVNIITNPGTISNPYTGTLTFGLSNDPANTTTFTVDVSDQHSVTPLTFSQDGTPATAGFITSFTATVNVVANNITGGTFSLKLANNNGSDPQEISGTFDGVGGYSPSLRTFSDLATIDYPTHLSIVNILNFGNAGPIGGSTISGTNVTIGVTPGSNLAHFNFETTIAGESNPTPLPAAAWGGLSLMGALGVGAMARRRRA